jgi:RPA family protein
MKREPAIKVRIKDIVDGKFIPGEKESMKPSYLITPFGRKISRVNVLATITDKFLNEDESYISFTLDDGTASIKAKAFRDVVSLVKNLEVGDIGIFIGKIREWNEEVYLNIEVARKIEDPNYETYRKLELIKEILPYKRMILELKSMREKMSEEEFLKEAKKRLGLSEDVISFLIESEKIEEKDYKAEVLKVLKELDRGEGVDVAYLFEVMKLPAQTLDSILTELMSEGKIEEVEACKIKVRELDEI